MSRDLEEQLDEMGPEYRVVVARLRGARAAEDLGQGTLEARRGFVSKVFRLRSKALRPILTAASLALIVGLGVFVRTSQTPHTSQTSQVPCIRAPHEYRASVDEMIATQRADGSWQNDFLTRRNAAALRYCTAPAARIAYKKAMRNLRARGVL